MKKIVAGAAMAAVAIAVLSHFAPGLAERCMAKCRELMDRARR